MSDHPFDFVDDVLPEEPNGELVQWMAPKPLSLGLPQTAVAAAGAFALGALSAVAVLAVMHWIGPQREVEIPKTLKKLKRKLR